MDNRELDKRIAEMLGYTIYHYDKDIEENCYFMLWNPNGGFSDIPRQTEIGAWDDCPKFTEDISSAFEVFEKVLKGFTTGGISENKGGYACWFMNSYGDDTPDHVIDAEEDTAPLAICKAALLSLEGRA